MLDALKPYAAEQGWSEIEGYPFEDEAFTKHGLGLDWAGFAGAYKKAGFDRVGPHWLNAADYPRSIYSWPVTHDRE